LKRIEDEDSDQDEGGQDQGDDREAIANQLFEGSDNVSKAHSIRMYFLNDVFFTYY